MVEDIDRLWSLSEYRWDVIKHRYSRDAEGYFYETESYSLDFFTALRSADAVVCIQLDAAVTVHWTNREVPGERDWGELLMLLREGEQQRAGEASTAYKIQLEGIADI